VTPLERALRSGRALAAIEEDLIARARELYRLGFSCATIAPAQMSAFGEILRTASNREEALAATDRWMQGQLKKLEDEADRRRPRSWFQAPAGGTEPSLGTELMAWIRDERFLGESPDPDLDRLVVLRRFWERFHGLYRYEAEIQGEMPLPALDLQEKGDEPR
jgi:hypothetical protein